MVLLRRTHYIAPRPPTGPVFHAATYLERSSGWAGARAFSRYNRQIEAQLGAAPGALAYTLQRQLFGREFWTLSLWVDRASMLAFVRAGSHRAAADWLRGSGQNPGKFAQWESSPLSLRMEDAYVPLGVSPPAGRVLSAPTRLPDAWRRVRQ